MKTVAIIGAGPAGLAAAYELLSQSNEYQVIIYEKDDSVGGLSKTFEFEGGRVDIGGHRFFTKSSDVLCLWENILPISDKGMLARDRKSHILWNSKLIDYPIEFNIQTMQVLGLIEGAKVAISYLQSKCIRKDIKNLEDFYVDRFGRKLYSIFFRDYTRKLWGMPANKLSPDWGTQRIQNVSLSEVFWSLLGINNHPKERSFITQYRYPAFGAGQFWNALADRIVKMGGHIETNCFVNHLHMDDTHILSVEYKLQEQSIKKDCDYVISSMPLSELVMVVENSPIEVREIGKKLHYRDMVIVGIDLPGESMGRMFPKVQKDSWLYMQDVTMTFGRIQILNNWSPYAVKAKDHILLELEYFCDKGDALWLEDDAMLIKESLAELIQCGICSSDATISSYLVKRIEKAYPVYTDGYNQLDAVEEWIEGIDNLRCIGRNGQHRYNNMDHSVETGIAAARSILNENYNRKRIWNVNTDKEYLEK